MLKHGYELLQTDNVLYISLKNKRPNFSMGIRFFSEKKSETNHDSNL